jgi:hypothetical protein
VEKVVTTQKIVTGAKKIACQAIARSDRTRLEIIEKVLKNEIQ